MRHEVERANSTRLAALQSPPVSYDARDSGSAAPDKRKAVLAGMMVPERLVLKLGAQVMLVKNVDDQRGLVNGAVGRVLGFFKAPRGKSEGVLRNVVLSEDGKSVVFVGEGKENVKTTAAAKVEGEKPKSTADAELFPLVEFPTPMGRERVLVTRDEFRVEDNEGKILARRVQASNLPTTWCRGSGSSLLRVLCRAVPIRFLLSWRGRSPSTRARARPYSASRSISAGCLRRARAMSHCLALRAWRVCKSSGSTLRRSAFVVRFVRSTIVDTGIRIRFVRIPKSSNGTSRSRVSRHDAQCLLTTHHGERNTCTVPHTAIPARRTERTIAYY